MNSKQYIYSRLYGTLWQINKDKLHKINPIAKAGKQFYQQNLLTKNINNENNTEVTMNNSVLLMKDLRINHEYHNTDTIETITKNTNTPILLTNTPPKTSELIINTDIDKTKTIPDWDILTSTIKQCTNCNLYYGRKNTVLERGNRSAKWMFIGEAPNEQDEINDAPFTGNAGELLDKMIEAMHLDPQNDVYICNVVKCRPTCNRNLELNELNSCHNYLLSQIELVNPQIIIALGRSASLSLLKTDLATAKIRGKKYNFNNIPVIVTYHPSYLLRNPEAKKDAWQDLQLALRIQSEIN